MITRAELAAAVPGLGRRPDLLDRYYAPLLAALAEHEINTRPRIAAFLAQMGHESQDFTALVENMNYSAARLRQVFPRYFPTYALALAHAHQPEKIANRVYANRLGNGPPESGDGWRFRGNGITHLTGRANHADAGRAIGVDLVANPELARQPEHMFRIAGWFWQTRGLNAYADRGQFDTITQRINGGQNGAPDRRLRWDRAKRALGAGPVAPTPAPATPKAVAALAKPAVAVGAVATASGAAAAHNAGLGATALEWMQAHPVGLAVIAFLLVAASAGFLYMAVRLLKERAP